MGFTDYFSPLKSFDMYGAPVQLGILGKSSSRSIIGAFVSLSALILSIYMTSDTITNLYYGINPLITRTSTYGISNVTFDSDNFFMALSFYSKGIDQGPDTFLGNSSNDLNETLKIYPVNYTCATCTGKGSDVYSFINDTNGSVCNSTNSSANLNSVTSNSSDCIKNISYDVIKNQGELYVPKAVPLLIKNVYNMIYCDKNNFNKSNLKINSFSKNKSDGIVDLFWTYSYCFPLNFSSIIMEDDIIDFSISLPINSVAIAPPFMPTTSGPGGVSQQMNNSLKNQTQTDQQNNTQQTTQQSNAQGQTQTNNSQQTTNNQTNNSQQTTNNQTNTQQIQPTQQTSGIANTPTNNQTNTQQIQPTQQNSSTAKTPTNNQTSTGQMQPTQEIINTVSTPTKNETNTQQTQPTQQTSSEASKPINTQTNTLQTKPLRQLGNYLINNIRQEITINK